MKLLIKKIISRACRNDLAWAALNATIIRVANYAAHERKKNADNSNTQSVDGFLMQSEIMKLSPNLAVMHGPFKGMHYPEMKSLGSSLAPKILGSYERELHQVIEQICLSQYTEIIDIGCAEGYYAVGMAMRIPTARVFAFDTNADAIVLCERMAQINNVAERLVTGSFCDTETLKSIPYTTKALIISDCEGYEKHLFTEEIVPILASHDLLIEVHDFIDIEISSMIRRRFEKTHFATSIQSIDDIMKAHSYDYMELTDYSLEHRRQLFAEYRPCIMEWLYMVPHSRWPLCQQGAAPATMERSGIVAGELGR
jgi:precorrin-6B methylase 2